jgi:hypothetical protein
LASIANKDLGAYGAYFFVQFRVAKSICHPSFSKENTGVNGHIVRVREFLNSLPLADDSINVFHRSIESAPKAYIAVAP